MFTFVLKFSKQERLGEVTVCILWLTSLKAYKIFSNLNTQIEFQFIYWENVSLLNIIPITQEKLTSELCWEFLDDKLTS